jgi:predicted glycosyltransferase
MRIWIDLANSPHPLLFAPIGARLRDDGHELLITARDHAQTLELARERFEQVDVIGSASPRSRIDKATAIVARMHALRRWAMERRPDVALSHNSYAQILAARSARISVVTAMDFEFQPSNHVAFRGANLVLLPEAVPLEVVRRQGARPGKVVRYPGLKEHIHLADFEPRPSVLDEVGLPAPEDGDGPLVVVRTPPTRAIYHGDENSAFVPLLRHVTAAPGVRCVVLVRYPEQREEIASLRLPGLTMPEHAIDSRSLMYEADVVIGAGGTMTRESALLGVPTYNMFEGQRPAVDLWLERNGQLHYIDGPERFPPIVKRASPPASLERLREQADAAIEGFTGAIARLAPA